MAKTKTLRGSRKQLHAEQHRRQKLQRNIWLGAGIAVLIALVGLAFWGFQRSQARQDVGEKVAYQGQQHIEEGESHAAYNSDPPTSGPHSANAIRAGFYDTPIPDENIIHNLEHGHVAISYDCDQLPDCETVQENLRRLVSRYNTWKVVAVPRQNRDAPLALTAWQRLELLESYDEARITAFIDAWRDKGPEKTPE